MARLRFFSGPMSSGKSTLALQMAYNYRAAGRAGVLLTRLDRSGNPVISSRLGVRATALEGAAGTKVLAMVSAAVRPGGFVVADEAQFYTPAQVDDLGAVVDDLGVDVDAFGLLTDFTSHLFPGTGRLVELADELIRLQVVVLCWCGAPGVVNARLVDGSVVHTGDQIVVGDIGGAGKVHYQVLCRAHWRAGLAGPAVAVSGTGLGWGADPGR